MVSENPIYSDDFELDCTILADILGLFVRCDPSQNPLRLPEFRLKHLCDCVSSWPKHADSDVLEAVASLYALCMYIICTGDLQTISRENMNRIINIIEVCGCEALTLLAENDNINLTHPTNSVKSLHLEAASKGEFFQYEAFQKSLDLAKEITKDVMKQTRKARDEVDRRTYMKAKMVEDCFLPHSVYFLCLFALSHAAIICTKQSIIPQICDYPGLMDCIILAVFTTENTADVNNSQHEMDHHIITVERNNIYKIRSQETEKKRLSICLLQVRDMAYSIMDKLEIDHIKASSILKTKIMRNISKSDVNFAKMQVSNYEKYSKIGYHDVTLKYDMELGSKVFKDVNFAKSIFLAGEDIWSKFVDVKGAKQSNSCITIDRQKETFRGIHPRLRSVYQIFMYFSPINKGKLRISGTDANFEQKTLLCLAIETMKSVLSKWQDKIPRVLNSGEGQFWCSSFLCDLILEKCIEGSFLCRNDEMEIKYLRKNLVNMQEEQFIPGTAHSARSSGEADIVNRALNSKQKASLRSNENKILSDTSKLSLLDKLHLASSKAKVESDISNLKSSIKTLKDRFDKKNLCPKGKSCSLELLTSKRSGHSGRKISVVWSTPLPKKVDPSLNSITKAVSLNIDVPIEASRTYAAKLNKWKVDRDKTAAKSREDTELAQELEVGKIKTRRLLTMRKRLETRRMNHEKSVVMKQLKDEKVKSLQSAIETKNKEFLLKESLLKEKERFRLKQLYEKDVWAEKSLCNDMLEREEFEKVHLRGMADRKEMIEILRRNEEEARMKVLEGRQRAIEAKQIAIENESTERMKDVRDIFETKRNLTTANIRKGVFKWRRGILGYYRDARQNEVPWIQYEDENGRLFYYDSIDNKTQYHVPNDSYILNASDVAIEEYETIHGPGSYAIMLADHAWKDEANANGGYYDDKGRWKTLRGYWDTENDYQWVDTSHGYYNENGEFVLHPPVAGDLDFMV